MSYPISYCAISAAIFGEEKAREDLIRCMVVNDRAGHWSQFPCKHSPPCPPPSPEQLAALNEDIGMHSG